MNAYTKVSERGQVVIPKDVRDRLRLGVGDRLEVIERADGVLLRKPADGKSGRSFEEITAKIRGRIKYDGPSVSIDDMNESIREASIASAIRRDDRARNRH